MKTQTQVQIELNSLQPLQNMHIEPNGYLLKFFMSCSEVYSKPFKVRDSPTDLGRQKLKVKNILGDQLEIWLCNTEDKIIANTTVYLIKEGDQEIDTQLKLNNIPFAKLNSKLSIIKTEIEKVVYVEPDEQLLKKQEDPEAARLREQEKARKLKEQQELQKLAQQDKKHSITKTYRNKKDEPFL